MIGKVRKVTLIQQIFDFFVKTGRFIFSQLGHVLPSRQFCWRQFRVAGSMTLDPEKILGYEVH